MEIESRAFLGQTPEGIEGFGRPALGLKPYAPAYTYNIQPGYLHRPLVGGLRRTTQSGRAMYLTFRTITEDAPGWWIPPRPPARPPVVEQGPGVQPVMATVGDRPKAPRRRQPCWAGSGRSSRKASGDH